MSCSSVRQEPLHTAHVQDMDRLTLLVYRTETVSHRSSVGQELPHVQDMDRLTLLVYRTETVSHRSSVGQEPPHIAHLQDNDRLTPLICKP